MRDLVDFFFTREQALSSTSDVENRTLLVKLSCSPRGLSQPYSLLAFAGCSYVHIGPSFPGSGRSPSLPMLYMSIRDGLGQRGVHYIMQVRL